MQRMLESGPLPVYGIPRVSSSACTVPSSPPRPCRQMNATSGASSMREPVVPSSMSRGWTSWPRRSRPCCTLFPVTKEMSRSIEVPPRRTTTRAIPRSLPFRARGEAGGAGAPPRAALRTAFQVAAELHALAHDLGEQLDAAPYPLGLDEGEVQPHVVLAGLPGVEALARHVGDVARDGPRQHRRCVEVRGQGSPHEEPALGVRPVDLLGHELREGFEHRVAALPVHAGEAPDVGAPVGVLEVGVDHHLREVRGAEVGALLADVDLVQYPRLGVHPSEPHAGREDLRERPEVDHAVHDALLLLLQRREGGERLALEAEHPVRVVLHDDQVELARDPEQLPPALCHQRHPCGVLEVGDGVEELDVEALLAGLAERLAGGHRDHAGPIHRDVRYARPVGGEGVEGAGVGGPLAQYGVALVEEDLGDEVEPLLGAGGDEDVLLPRGRPLGRHHLDYDVLYGLEARGRTVLQRLGGVGGYAAGGLAKSLLAEGPRVGEAPRERDYAGPREGGHEVARGGRLHPLDPLGVEEVEAVEVYERQLHTPTGHEGLYVLPTQGL